ncbi:MAG TPA: VacJ family lipoprotein [Woeseiaceae bacterium]|nr:VacJ family lipoprotein [Woeseiaceae bacterium]
MQRRGTVIAIAIGLLIVLSGCASIPPGQRAAADPWEPMNRTLYKINTSVDRVTTKPLARGYQKILPTPIQNGVSNFFQNLTTPRSVLNNFLQGKPKRGLSEAGRFLFNSSLGIGGLFDVASASGMEEYPEDFGQTAAVWGVPDGPYIMLPFFGPRTLRDAVLMPLDTLSHPLYHYDNTSVRDKLVVLQIVDLRQNLLTAEKFLEDSKDPYVTLRESYLQNREFEVYDGNPPEDDFYEDFDEDY